MTETKLKNPDECIFPEIKVGDIVWFCPAFDGCNIGGLFFVKCIVKDIYILDTSKNTIINGIPCGTIVPLQSDYENNIEGAIVFYDLDEPTGSSVGRDSIWSLEEEDVKSKENIISLLEDYKGTEENAYNNSLDDWRSRNIAFIKKTGGTPAEYKDKQKDADWICLKRSVS